MATFRETLHQQRWDDHRFYHHSMINQSLHLFSATTFIFCYILLPFDVGLASFIAWTLAMCSRQSGHFFFEPTGYDNFNDVTHEHKEEVKTGYNLFRKWVLMIIWLASPLVLAWSPTLFGAVKPRVNKVDLLRHIGYVWLCIAVAAVLIRVFQLWMSQGLQAGVAWATKILTDPFYDIKLYHSSPMRFLKGERLDHGLDAHGEMDEEFTPEPQI